MYLRTRFNDLHNDFPNRSFGTVDASVVSSVGVQTEMALLFKWSLTIMCSILSLLVYQVNTSQNQRWRVWLNLKIQI